MRILFEILGEPKPKARHRTARTKDGRLIQYNDKTAQGQVDNFIAQAIRYAPPAPLISAITLTVAAYTAIPQSWARKKREKAARGELRPTKKPDADNLLKFVGDALNSLFWVDDKQIVAATIRKHYSDRPRWEIEIDA